MALDEATFDVAAYATVDDALQAFIERTAPARIERACLAVAGPIDGRTARLTNGRWHIDADALSQRLSVADLAVCNDFEAAALGLDALDVVATLTLQAAPAWSATKPGPRLLIGAGTGLGVAWLLAERDGTRVVAGEGGHVGFAPVDDEQAELVAYLRQTVPRVTAEHIVSGPGLARLYGFVIRRDGDVPDDVRLDGAAAVARRYASGEPAARQALRLFTSIFGAIAGDHALCVLATGGVFIGGGIAPRFPDAFADGSFMSAFLAKGAQMPLMAKMPVHVVLDDRLGLRGAALRAARQGSG